MVEAPFPPAPVGQVGQAPAPPAPRDEGPPLPEDEKLLDHVHELLLDGRVYEGMEELLLTLKARRLSAPREEWQRLVKFCVSHPLQTLLHQDPFTRHSFTKPRGYPGDAVLLDYIYGHDEGWALPEDTTRLGHAIHEFTIRSPACEGVRTRREFIANVLDELGSAGRPRVLSVAAGHLREAALSAGMKRRRFARFVAMDADAQSLREVERCYGRLGVEPLLATVRTLLSPSQSLGEFDLVYSTGLFDYLAQPTAQRLALALFRMLAPRGRLVLANFLPGIPDLGYMESYMAWELIYRTRAEMLDVAARIPQGEMRDIRLFAEENQNILFLEATRAG
jgi:extracellular factor (EF) 3-hydroxypalmitic acid methyl ester biosynthesis protein